MSEQFNGWANAETWAVYTWLTADDETTTDAETAARDGIAALQGLSMRIALADKAGLAADLLGFALERVDYDEVRAVLLGGSTCGRIGPGFGERRPIHDNV